MAVNELKSAFGRETKAYRGFTKLNGRILRTSYVLMRPAGNSHLVRKLVASRFASCVT